MQNVLKYKKRQLDRPLKISTQPHLDLPLNRTFTLSTYAALPLVTGTLGLFMGTGLGAVANAKFIRQGFVKQKFVVIFRTLTVTYTLAILGFIGGFFLGSLPYFFKNSQSGVNLTATNQILSSVDDATKTVLLDFFSKYAVSDLDIALMAAYITLVLAFWTAVFIKTVADRWELMLEFAVLTAASAIIFFIFFKFIFFMAFICYKIFILHDMVLITKSLTLFNFVTNPGSMGFAANELTSSLTCCDVIAQALAQESQSQVAQWFDLLQNTTASTADPACIVVLGLGVCGDLVRFLGFNELCSLITVIAYELSSMPAFVSGPWSEIVYGHCGLDFRGFTMQGVVSIYTVLLSKHTVHDFHRDSALEFIAHLVDALAPLADASSTLPVLNSALANGHHYAFVFLLLDAVVALLAYRLLRGKFWSHSQNSV